MANNSKSRRYYERKAAGICVKCEAPQLASKVFCANCLKEQKERNTPEAGKAWRLALKLEVLKAYGGRCCCCGEIDPVFLSIDHVNNDGAKHRKTLKSSIALYCWLRRNNYPTNFRVLCFNCNCGRQVNGGICPHETQRNAMEDIDSLSQKFSQTPRQEWHMSLPSVPNAVN